MPPAEHALWAEVGGGITFVTSGEYLKLHKIAYMNLWLRWGFMMWKPYMLAIVGQPSLHGSYACMVYWAQGGTLGEFAGINNVRPLFSPFLVFLFSRNSMVRFWGLGVLAFMDWEGSASWAFLYSLPLVVGSHMET